MDVQSAIVARFGEASDSLLAALAKATAAARAAGIPVIYVTIDLRPGFPDVSRRNRQFADIADSGRFQADDPGNAVHQAVGPQPGDIVVTKKRVSAFVGSDLEVVLRSLEVDSLILTGIATSGVVLSTVRQAADMDYQLTVLRDGCMDGDSEVHRVLIDKLFPRQAEVLSTGDWVEGLPRTPAG
jgi:nicotinamidase-related amidase